MAFVGLTNQLFLGSSKRLDRGGGAKGQLGLSLILHLLAHVLQPTTSIILKSSENAQIFCYLPTYKDQQ